MTNNLSLIYHLLAQQLIQHIETLDRFFIPVAHRRGRQAQSDPLPTTCRPGLICRSISVTVDGTNLPPVSSWMNNPIVSLFVFS